MGRKTFFHIKSILMVACLAGGLFPFTASATTVTFSTAGNESWQVPSGVTEITVKTWGAGGAGNNGAGGGGGFAQATLTVTPLETLTVYVGGGGDVSIDAYTGGGGGGYSAVTRGATYLVQAGGGGGGAAAGGQGASAPPTRFFALFTQTFRWVERALAVGTGAGGAGGGVNGANGDSGVAAGGGGGGDTGLTFNGGGGANSGAGGGDGSTNAGGGYTGLGNGGVNGGGDGGSAFNGAGGGGGGGGRYGGGQGGSDGLEQVAGGGGGGSSLVTGTGTVETAGSGTTPGNSGDGDYVNPKGVGGSLSSAGNDGYVVITYGGDTTAPTPNPATFSSAPAPDSTSQISMTATAATDPSTPVAYLFGFSACGANGGTGGTSSSWQASASYTDSILQPNQCYGYTITSRDAVPNTGTTSSASTTYTHANVPGAPSFGTVSATTMTLTNAENSNPSATPTTKFAVQVASTAPNDATWLNKYVDQFGNTSVTAVWLSDAELDGLVITGLQTGTLYGMQVKARNENSVETAFGSVGSGTPTASVVVRRVLLGGKVQFRGHIQLK